MEMEPVADQHLDNVSEEDSDDDDMSDEESSGIGFGPSSFLPKDPIGGVRKAVTSLHKTVSDKSHEMTEVLKPFLGKVFHAVGNTGTMYRYRVGLDGKLEMVGRLRGNLNETKGKILAAGKAVPIRARRKWRAAVTGDPEKRIRDHMKETPQVKMMDKVSFTLGVIVICFSEWLMLRHPNLFPFFYYCLMPILFIFRYFEYAAIKSELYMLDFCYFINFSVALQTAFDPDNMLWFQANYVLSMGPICFAIVIWRNSLVFHSLDKLTSFFLHSFPPMICHIYRWKIIDNNLEFGEGYMGLQAHIFYPMVIYLTWQFGYIFMTEVVLANRLRSDPELVTSLRYLSRDEKNSMTILTTVICRKFGFLKKGEPFNPETKFAKTVFILAQLGYTLATMSHTAFLFTTYNWSCLYIVSIFIQGVWNGASYYIEVFSKRYNLKFEEKKVTSNNVERREQEEASSDDYSSTNEDDQDMVIEFDAPRLAEALKNAEMILEEEESTSTKKTDINGEAATASSGQDDATSGESNN